MKKYLPLILMFGAVSMGPAAAFDMKLSNSVVSKAVRAIENCPDAACVSNALVQASQTLGSRPDYKAVQKDLLRAAKDAQSKPSKGARSALQGQKRAGRHKRDEIRIFTALFAATNTALK